LLKALFSDHSQTTLLLSISKLEMNNAVASLVEIQIVVVDTKAHITARISDFLALNEYDIYIYI